VISIVDVKSLFPLELEEDVITPHLKRAEWDYKETVFETTVQELEVIGSKTIYYLAPLLYSAMQNRAAEYSDSLDRFRDVVAFGKVWLDRANSALNKTNNDEMDEIRWNTI